MPSHRVGRSPTWSGGMSMAGKSTAGKGLEAGASRRRRFVSGRAPLAEEGAAPFASRIVGPDVLSPTSCCSVSSEATVFVSASFFRAGNRGWDAAHGWDLRPSLASARADTIASQHGSREFGSLRRACSIVGRSSGGKGARFGRLCRCWAASWATDFPGNGRMPVSISW